MYKTCSCRRTDPALPIFGPDSSISCFPFLPNTIGSPGFWLLASFSRSKFKMSSSVVAKILASAIGGNDSLLCVPDISDWIFKFKVSSRDVGLLIYDLKVHSCLDFKLAFHLCNERGFLLARKFLTQDHSPEHPWSRVDRVNGKRSYF